MFGPDGQWIVSGCSDGTLKVWTAEGNDELRLLFGHKSEVRAVRFSSDEAYAETRSVLGDLIIWDLKSGTIVTDPESIETTWGDSQVSARSPSGRWLAFPRGYNIVMIDLHFTPTPAERKRRERITGLVAGWHEARASDFEKNGNLYGEVFHRAWLVKSDPNDDAVKNELHAAYEQLQASQTGKPIPVAPIVTEMLALPLDASKKAAPDSGEVVQGH